jgi:pyridoxine/pyridoxamine 5'-phosphate oxidase
MATSASSSPTNPSQSFTPFKSQFLSNIFQLPYTNTSSSQSIPSFQDLSTWPNDPMEIFCSWYIDAEKDYWKHTACTGCNNTKVCHGVPLPNTMQVATIDPTTQHPHIRTVLLKGIDSRGLIFFSNYHSNKGQQLLSHPYIAVNMYMKGLERQIRIEGEVEILESIESDIYFHERPIASQIGASVSQQSSVIVNRNDLEERYLQSVHDIAQRIEQHHEHKTYHKNATTLDNIIADTSVPTHIRLQQAPIISQYHHQQANVIEGMFCYAVTESHFKLHITSDTVCVIVVCYTYCIVLYCIVLYCHAGANRNLLLTMYVI